MDKITKLIEILDPKMVDNLIYLDRLLRLYVRFMKDYKHVVIRSDGNNIVVKFYIINREGHMNSTERSFTFNELPEKINSYKLKVRKEIKGRSNNPRIKREKEIHKWRKVIEYAKLQMSE